MLKMPQAKRNLHRDPMTLKISRDVSLALFPFRFIYPQAALSRSGIEIVSVLQWPPEIIPRPKVVDLDELIEARLLDKQLGVAESGLSSVHS
jgi:hypothetical protein